MLIDRLTTDPIANRAIAHATIREIVETTSAAAVVKIGLLLLGAVGDETDNRLFGLVGMHSDFTWFACVAISLANEDPISTLLALAPGTTEWGRVNVIEALLRFPSEKGREYLLRRGFDTVSSELAAEVTWQVATECDLAAAIDVVAPDEELVRGVGRILAILAQSPFRTLADYTESGRATRRFLEHFGQLAETIEDYGTVLALHDVVIQEPGAGPAPPWSGDRARIVELASAILERPEWRGTAIAAFDDPGSRNWALRFAKRIGIPYRERLLNWIRLEPLDSSNWYFLCEDVSAADIDAILSLANEVLDVGAIAVGPANDLGLGRKYAREMCVGYILQALKGIPSGRNSAGRPGIPGKGEDVLLAALRSRVIRLRRQAIGALEGWPTNWITPQLRDGIAELAISDPNKDARNEAIALLGRIGPPTVH